MLQFSTTEKETIASLIMKEAEGGGFVSLSDFARKKGLLPADMTNIKAAKWKEQPHLIGEAKWINLARIAGFDKRQDVSLKIAQTETVRYVVAQLKSAQQESLANMLVDDAGLGKSIAAEWYCKNNRYAFHIDCCSNPSKATFIRAIAQAVGAGRNGKLNDLLDDAIYTLRQMENPILILDEAGDLEHASILLLKRLYNALKGICGFYMIGADGFKKKIKTGVANEKLGFVEVFSRYGRNFKRITPELFEERVNFYRHQAIEMAYANGLTKDEAAQIAKMVTKGGQLNDMRFIADKIKGVIKQKQTRHETNI